MNPTNVSIPRIGTHDNKSIYRYSSPFSSSHDTTVLNLDFTQDYGHQVNWQTFELLRLK